MKRLGSLFLIWLVFVGFTFSDRYLATAFAKSNMSIAKASIDDQANTLYIKVTDPEPPQLCNSTKRLLARLRQQMKLELYYAKSVAINRPDLRTFGDYYESAYQLLKQYEAASRGKIELRVIDPEPYSLAEEAAILSGLTKFEVSEERNFFMGLVIRTKYGVKKVIPFLSPDRRDLLEYDITSLIDNAMICRKRRIGIISSLQVMGDDVSSYMAELMRLQGQEPKQPWTFVEHLRKEYEVETISANTVEINDVDILLVIHPKDLSERTLFAIDQFVLRGGRAVVCVDPYCFADRPDPKVNIQNAAQQPRNSELDRLLKTWDLEMSANTFAGDRNLALMASVRAEKKPEKIIGYLNMVPGEGCFAADNVITCDLSQVRFLFSGVLREIADSSELEESRARIKRTPLIMTTCKGGTFSISNPYEMMFLDPSKLMQKFVDGDKPLAMGYLITGRFRSCFPDGITIEVKDTDDKSSAGRIYSNKEKAKRLIRGLSQAEGDCAVVVFADVDFISDALAYQTSFFGKTVVGDNYNLLLKAISSLLGSGELIEMVSRGIDRQPRDLIDEIRHRIDKTYEEEVVSDEISAIRKEVESFNDELKNLLDTTKDEEYKSVTLGNSIRSRKAELEKKILKAERVLRRLKYDRHKKLEQLEKLAKTLGGFNIPASLADELDLEDLESMVVASGSDSVRLRRRGGGIVVIVKETHHETLADNGDPVLRQESTIENEFVPGPLIQGLDISQIGYIKVGKNNDSIIFRRVEDHFVAVDKDDYPAQMSAINKLISSCLNMRVTGRIITDSTKIHRAQWMTEKSAEIIVQFLNSDKILLIGFTIEKLDQQRQTHFVRLLPGNDIYIAEQVPSVDNDVLHYIDRTLLSVQKDDIESVTVFSGLEKYTIKAQQDGSCIIKEDKHDGRRVETPETNRVFQALCCLQFDDVVNADELTTKLEFVHKYVCRMRDSTEYICNISQMNDNFYMTIDSEFTDKTPITKSRETESLKVLKEKESLLLAKDHALKFSQKHKGWIYRIPKESGDNMTQELKSLLK